MGERKPDINMRGGNNTFLSIWIGSNVKIVISRKSGDGFERIDSYTIPLDYLILRIFDRSRDVLKRFCEFVDALED